MDTDLLFKKVLNSEALGIHKFKDVWHYQMKHTIEVLESNNNKD